MSHSQFRRIILILTHAWLNLWDKHMTTGRINQITTFAEGRNPSQCNYVYFFCIKMRFFCDLPAPWGLAWSESYILLAAAAEAHPLKELLSHCDKGPLKDDSLIVGQNTARHLQLTMFAHYGLVLLCIIPYRYVYNISPSQGSSLDFPFKD